jgi:preprotein translocase subunit SecY
MVLTLTAGTAFIMWLGELITQRGIGNGMSLIIFAAIVASLPGQGAAILARDDGTILFIILCIVALLLIVVSSSSSRASAASRCSTPSGRSVAGRTAEPRRTSR